MNRSPSLAGGRDRWPLCGTLVPEHSQVIVLVVIFLLAVTIGIAAPTPAAAASTAALVQAGAALWIVLRRSGASAAES